MSVKRRWLIGPIEDSGHLSVPVGEIGTMAWGAPAEAEAVVDEADSLKGSAAVRRRQARALVQEWVRGEEAAGPRIRRMLENGDGETRLALVEALPNAVPFEVIEAALKGMRRSFLGGSAKGERLGWTLVSALLIGGLVVDLGYTVYAANQWDLQPYIPIAVFLATMPGLVAWQVMCIHRRMQMAIDTQRQQQYFARVAVIARASLQRDPSQYAQPVLHRLEEMAPVVELEGGTTKKVYRHTVEVFRDAVAHLRSLPIAAEHLGAGPESLPVPTSLKLSEHSLDDLRRGS